MLVLVEDAPETVAPVYMKAGVDVGREERRKSAQVVEVRSGAGSIPACRRDLHTVEAEVLMPRTSSSPWMRR